MCQVAAAVFSFSTVYRYSSTREGTLSRSRVKTLRVCLPSCSSSGPPYSVQAPPSSRYQAAPPPPSREKVRPEA